MGKLYVLIIIITSLVVIGLVLFMYNSSKECMANPYTYGASQMGKVQCSCTQDTGRSTPATFEFNDTDFWSNPTTPLYPPIDMGNLVIP